MDSKHVLAEQKIQATTVENKPDLARMICRFYLKFYDSAHKLAHKFENPGTAQHSTLKIKFSCSAHCAAQHIINPASQ